MSDAVDIWERPQTKEIYLIAGWRQWADAGSISSGLPRYLIQQTGARQIGTIRPDGFYLFQIPGTHDLVRPTVKFENGYPVSLEERRNELYYAGDEQRGVIFFVGDEPHLDIDRYGDAFIHVVQSLSVKRVISLGGVYGELPYDKERTVSCVYSLTEMKPEMDALAVNLSDYQGGASIGSYLCRRAGEQGLEFVGFYAFVPTYDFSKVAQIGNSIRIENDFMAWLGVMRRINHMLGTDFDLSDLEQKSDNLIEVVDSKIEEIDQETPQVSMREYMDQLAEEYEEVHFNPLDDVWEEELRRLFDESDEAEA